MKQVLWIIKLFKIYFVKSYKNIQWIVFSKGSLIISFESLVSKYDPIICVPRKYYHVNMECTIQNFKFCHSHLCVTAIYTQGSVAWTFFQLYCFTYLFFQYSCYVVLCTFVEMVTMQWIIQSREKSVNVMLNKEF